MKSVPCPPPPPLTSPSLCNPPPRGGRPSLHCFARQYLLRGFVFPSVAHTFLHCFPLLRITHLYSVIVSLQRRCTGCRVPFSDPRCFLPVTVYGTTHAHLVHMCWPLLWGLERPLQSAPLPPGERPSLGGRLPPWGGDCRALRGEISRVGQGNKTLRSPGMYGLLDSVH